jgi:HrpA-like RNA helicase
LDQTLLSLLFLGLEKTLSGTFLNTLLDPPSRESIAAAVSSLGKLGAVETDYANGVLQLTPLGQHLAGIPAPPTIGKCKWLINTHAPIAMLF